MIPDNIIDELNLMLIKQREERLFELPSYEEVVKMISEEINKPKPSAMYLIRREEE